MYVCECDIYIYISDIYITDIYDVCIYLYQTYHICVSLFYHVFQYVKGKHKCDMSGS